MGDNAADGSAQEVKQGGSVPWLGILIGNSRGSDGLERREKAPDGVDEGTPRQTAREEVGADDCAGDRSEQQSYKDGRAVLVVGGGCRESSGEVREEQGPLFLREVFLVKLDDNIVAARSQVGSYNIQV